ncbi:MAG: NAD(P)-dependent oxidoreductase [Pirellulales bacterium]|nr:NAD(P)-dependent oxidoreductase [Pirellulales bacterium]
MLSIRRVMVTGASGKLGGPVCEALVEAGYEVVAVRHRNSVDVPGVHQIALDLADPAAVEKMVGKSDAVIHLATCKEDRNGVIDVSARGTFNLLDAAARTRSVQRFLLASGDAVNGIYFNPQPVPIREDIPLVAYPGYYPLSKVIEETMAQQFFHQAGVPTVILRMSWIHAEDDILSHLTVAGEPFGIPVWRDLMSATQRSRFDGGADAAVALRHPDGRPVRRHIVAVEDCVQAHRLALTREGIEGQTFMIAMDNPFDYVEVAEYTAKKLGIETLDLVDPVGQDFAIDISKARYLLGYRPDDDIFRLIDRAVEFRRAGRPRRQRAGYQG